MSSIALQARMLEASAVALAANMAQRIDRMVAIQMEAYPSHWTEDERREMAVRHLLGVAS